MTGAANPGTSISDGDGLAHSVSGSAGALLPWVGSPAFRALRVTLGTRLGWNNMEATNPFVLIAKPSERRLSENLAAPPTRDEGRENLPLTQIPRPDTFDPYIPNELLRDRYQSDHLELDRAIGMLAKKYPPSASIGTSFPEDSLDSARFLAATGRLSVLVAADPDGNSVRFSTPDAWQRIAPCEVSMPVERKR